MLRPLQPFGDELIYPADDDLLCKLPVPASRVAFAPRWTDADPSTFDRAKSVPFLCDRNDKLHFLVRGFCCNIAIRTAASQTNESLGGESALDEGLVKAFRASHELVIHAERIGARWYCHSRGS